VDSREAFGPNLRRLRLQRNISLESIAEATNVPVPLWEALEDNDLYGWPSGVLARTFVAEYARLIGEDPEETVNEFCRLFPHGDRRRSRLIADYAGMVGQPLVWSEDHPPVRERRAPMQRALEERKALGRERLAATLIDLAVIALGSAASSLVGRFPYAASLLVVGSGYYFASGALGWSIGTSVRHAAARRQEKRLVNRVSLTGQNHYSI